MAAAPRPATEHRQNPAIKRPKPHSAGVRSRLHKRSFLVGRVFVPTPFASVREDGTVPASIPALVEPSVLRWARETIDLSPVAASRKLGLRDDQVEAWESGRARPTVAQLRKAAKLYRRSLGVFFLPAPPEGFDTLRDFRRHEGAAAAPWSPALHADYRRAHVQREYVLELAVLTGHVDR